MDVISDYFIVKVWRFDVMLVWSGIWFLVMDFNVKDIDMVLILRDYVVCVDFNGLVIVIGGKWMIYWSMVEDVVNVVVKMGVLKLF